MKTIIIDELFRIKIDANNFELVREEKIDSEDKNGNPKQTTRMDNWYYPKLEQTLGRYLTESIRPSKDVQQILQNISQVHKTIKELPQKINN